jgi:hypothetical protein
MRFGIAAPGLLSEQSMSGERFDSGGVLARGRAVLTFATAVREAKPARVAKPRKRADTPTPPPTTSDAVRRERRALPVIPRIVRRTIVDGNGAFLRPIAQAAKAARSSALATVVVAALALAVFGVLAGLGMRSLSDPTNVAAAAPVADATLVDRPLARGPSAAREERASAPPSAPVVGAELAVAPAAPLAARVAPTRAQSSPRGVVMPQAQMPHPSHPTRVVHAVTPRPAPPARHPRRRARR